MKLDKRIYILVAVITVVAIALGVVVVLNNQYGLTFSGSGNSQKVEIVPIDSVIQKRWDPEGVFNWPSSGNLISWESNSESEYAIFEIPSVNSPLPWSTSTSLVTIQQIEYNNPLSSQLFVSTRAMLNDRIATSYNVGPIQHGFSCDLVESSGAKCKWEFWDAGEVTIVHVQRSK